MIEAQMIFMACKKTKDFFVLLLFARQHRRKCLMLTDIIHAFKDFKPPIYLKELLSHELMENSM